MRVNITRTPEELRRIKMPSMEEKLEALLEGGDVLDQLKAKIATVEARYSLSSTKESEDGNGTTKS